MLKTIYYRKYGEPKLPKPKELKGINKCNSTKIRGRKCDMYLKGGEIWFYFGDFLSEYMSFPEAEDMDLSTNALNKKYGLCLGNQKGFIYDDAWCPILLRNEAWLCLEKTVEGIKKDGISNLLGYTFNLVEYIRKSEYNKGYNGVNIMGETCTLNMNMVRCIEDNLIMIIKK